jgi:hypothetical protein
MRRQLASRWLPRGRQLARHHGHQCSPTVATMCGEMKETEKGEDKVGEERLGVWMRF